MKDEPLGRTGEGGDHEGCVTETRDQRVRADVPPSFLEPGNLRPMVVWLLALFFLMISGFAGLAGVVCAKAGFFVGVGISLALSFLALLAAVALGFLGWHLCRPMRERLELRPRGPKEKIAMWGVGISVGAITVCVHVLGRAGIGRIVALGVIGLVLGCLGLASSGMVLAREEGRRFKESDETSIA